MIYKKITSGSIASCTYILGDEETKEAVIIDPGYTQEEADVFIEEEDLKIKWIINTHGHADHVHNNAYFKNKYQAPIAIHEDDADYLSDPNKNLSEYLGYALSSPPADRLLKDQDEIMFGKEKLLILHTPGHTPGGITLKHNQAIFVGDLIFNGSVGRTDLLGGDHKLLMQSIEDVILPLPDETIIYSGHGHYQTTVGEQRKVNPFFQDIIGGHDE